MGTLIYILYIISVGHVLGSLALDIPVLFPSPSGGDTALVCRGDACSKDCLISTPLIDGLDILIGGAVEIHPSVSVESTFIFSEGRWKLGKNLCKYLLPIT